MDALTALQTRTATPRLKEPAPQGKDLEEILKAGLRAPDHGMLRPWKFLLVEGDARVKLGEMFVESLQPDTDERRQKLLDAPMRAPLLIVCIAKIRVGDKIPRIEQVGSMAAAIQNMSVAIHALGYGSIWRTGPVAHADQIKLALGQAETDEIVGYLYVGTPAISNRPVPEHNLADYVSSWPA